MKLIPVINFSQFKERVLDTIESRRDIDERDYQEFVGRIANEKFKPEYWEYLTKEPNVEKWETWLGDAENGFDTDWGRLRNLSQARVYDLTRATNDFIHAIAIHYRFHGGEREAKFAKEIDEWLFSRRFASFGSPVFFEPSKTPTPTAPFVYPPYLSRQTVDEILRVNPSDSVWLNPHNHHSIPLIGRIDENKILTHFMGRSESFLIVPIIGPSGSGKTRLVSEWMKSYVPTTANTTWDAGILSSHQPGARDEDPWKQWSPGSDTLIVIDNALGFDRVAEAIADSARNRHRGHRVRLVVIDQQFPSLLYRDTFWRYIYPSKELYDKQFLPEFVDPIYLFESREQASITKQLFDFVYSSTRRKMSSVSSEAEPMSGESVDFVSDSLGERLLGTNSPLIAAIVARSAAKHGKAFSSIEASLYEGVLDYYFRGTHREPWRIWTSDVAGAPLGARYAMALCISS
ncbi:MAG: ATP-binding protein, partial [Pseudomonadota bacterium]